MGVQSQTVEVPPGHRRHGMKSYDRLEGRQLRVLAGYFESRK